MKAARIHKNSSSLVIDEIDVPKISQDQVLVRVRAAGVCHTELHFLDGTIPISGGALTLGHEIAGDIVEIGANVRDFSNGDRVIINNGVPCNNCRQCLVGNENVCENLEQMGFTLDGGYAEYVKVRADRCVKISKEVSYETGAALTCGAATCQHALFDIGNLTSGQTLLINGMGGVGFSALQIAKSAGATCISVDVVDEKLEIAKNRFLADKTINGRKENVVETVREFTSGRGVDILLELVGIPATMKYSIDVLGKKGRVVFVGYSKSDYVVSPLAMILKEASVLSAIAYKKSDLEAVRDLAASGKLKPLIVGHYRLSEIEEPLNQLKAGTAVGRSVILFD